MEERTASDAQHLGRENNKSFISPLSSSSPPPTPPPTWREEGGTKTRPSKLPQVGVCSQVRDVVPVDTYLYVTLQLMRL